MSNNDIVRNRRASVVGSRKPQNKTLIRTGATRLFEVRGYHPTTVDDIASATNLNKATLYHYYASKREILFDICESALDALLERFSHHDLSDPPRARLQLAIADVVEVMAQDRSRTAVYYQERPFIWQTLGAEAYRELRIKEQQYFRHIQQIIESGIDRGELAAVDPEAAVYTVVAAAGQTYLWFDPEGGRGIAEVLATTSTIVLRGLERSE